MTVGPDDGADVIVTASPSHVIDARPSGKSEEPTSECGRRVVPMIGRRRNASVRKVLRDDALEHEVLSELATAAHAAGDTHTASVAEQRMESLR